MNIKQKIRQFILKETIPIPANLYCFLFKLLSKCKECLDGIIYPTYGIAPHIHDLSLTSSFIGSTKIISQKEWPENYDDVDNGCGVYYCTDKNCTYSKENQTKEKNNA